MKTDKYKDWESKFFGGEELTPEEELFLKNESDDPYFTFLKEEKKVKLDIGFDDFLKKTETPKIVALPIAKTKSYTQYWMAASVILLMGISGLWLFNQSRNAHVEIVKAPMSSEKTLRKQDNPTVEVKEKETPKQVLASQQSQKVDLENNKIVKDLVKKEVEKLMAKNNQFSPVEKQKKQKTVESVTEYQPNYVIINGKPIYDESEAIAVTENAFNYFASNVTQTINKAESAHNQVDFYKIINY